jgi:hypothetical protein
LVGVDQLVRQTLPGGVFVHLYSGASDYSRVVCTRLRLHLEELPEQDPVGVGLIPTNASQKCTKMEMWKILLMLRYSMP